MIILLFIESRLNFKNIPLNSTFKSSINYEYIVYRNENPIYCFLEFLVSLNKNYTKAVMWTKIDPNNQKYDSFKKCVVYIDYSLTITKKANSSILYFIFVYQYFQIICQMILAPFKGLAIFHMHWRK